MVGSLVPSGTRSTRRPMCRAGSGRRGGAIDPLRYTQGGEFDLLYQARSKPTATATARGRDAGRLSGECLGSRRMPGGTGAAGADRADCRDEETQFAGRWSRARARWRSLSMKPERGRHHRKAHSQALARRRLGRRSTDRGGQREDGHGQAVEGRRKRLKRKGKLKLKFTATAKGKTGRTFTARAAWTVDEAAEEEEAPPGGDDGNPAPGGGGGVPVTGSHSHARA